MIADATFTEILINENTMRAKNKSSGHNIAIKANAEEHRQYVPMLAD